MYKMYDIHTHIIPCVDDGAWSQEMAEMLGMQAAFQGVEKIIATPHSSAFESEETREQVTPNFEALAEWAKNNPLGLKFYQGCEVYCSWYSMKQVLHYLADDIIPTMNGTRFVLAEFSTSASTDEIFYCVEQLLKSQYLPILAHVERYQHLFWENDLEKIKELKEKGCLLQVNVYSVQGEAKEEIRKNAIRLFDRELVDFLGSDMHRTFYRPPMVEEGLEFLYQTYRKEYVDRIAYENAENLLLMK